MLSAIWTATSSATIHVISHAVNRTNEPILCPWGVRWRPCQSASHFCPWNAIGLPCLNSHWSYIIFSRGAKFSNWRFVVSWTYLQDYSLMEICTNQSKFFGRARVKAPCPVYTNSALCNNYATRSHKRGLKSIVPLLRSLLVGYGEKVHKMQLNWSSWIKPVP